jgi:hypothetical protein
MRHDQRSDSLRLFRGILLAVFGLGLSGCALDHRTYGTAWSADPVRLPDIACARGAVAAIDQVRKVETATGSLGIYLKSEKYSDAELEKMNADTEALMRTHGNADYRTPADISVFLSAPGKPPTFHMTYMGWRKPEDRTETVAHRVVAEIAARCDLPSLAVTAVEKQDPVATPYLFGM